MGIRVANVIEEGRLAGPQIRIVEVAKALKKKGVETTVIFPFLDSQEFQNRLEMSKVKYFQLPFNRPTKVKKKLLRYLVFFIYEIWLLYRLFRKYKFDVVHASGGSMQFKSVLAGRLAGLKVIWHLNDTQMPNFVRALFKIIANRFPDGFVVAGERVRKYYLEELKVGKGKFTIEIQAPVDCSHFNGRDTEPNEKMVSHKGVNIVSVGNVNPFKGIETFLSMANELNEKYLDLNFWMIGPIFNSQKHYLKKLMKVKKEYNLDNFHFYGACYDIRKVLKCTDVYVCSSAAEASPTSVWEAMSMGKAVVSTDVGDVSRFIEDGKNGYIVPVGDASLMSKRVRELIEDIEKRKKFGRLARQTAIEKLDILNCARGHKEAYSQIMKH